VAKSFQDMVRGQKASPMAASTAGSVQLTLIRCVLRSLSTQKKAKIGMNFLAAAMHLSFLKSAVQNTLNVDLPDNASALLGRFVASDFCWYIVVLILCIAFRPQIASSLQLRLKPYHHMRIRAVGQGLLASETPCTWPSPSHLCACFFHIPCRGVG
jgi:hypothetical protein